jgi:hypothetical protein
MLPTPVLSVLPPVSPAVQEQSASAASILTLSSTITVSATKDNNFTTLVDIALLALPLFPLA